MHFLRNLILSVGSANAFFFSSCQWPTRSTPSVSEIAHINLNEPNYQQADLQLSPPGYMNAPSATGRITNGPELFQALKATYNLEEGAYGPISVSKSTLTASGAPDTTVYLVLIAGTNFFAGFWETSNDAIANLQIFFNADADSRMEKNARYAIQNEVPRGGKVVIVGHSQGGMVARQIASHPDIKNHVEVLRVITLGSPNTDLIEPREGSLIMFQSPDDLVAKLDEAADWAYDFCNWVTFGWFCPEMFHEEPETITIDSSFSDDRVKAHTMEYLREDNDVFMQYDAMGYKGGDSVITWDVTRSHRAFYTAPSNTCAE